MGASLLLYSVAVLSSVVLLRTSVFLQRCLAELCFVLSSAVRLRTFVVLQHCRAELSSAEATESKIVVCCAEVPRSVGR